MVVFGASGEVVISVSTEGIDTVLVSMMGGSVGRIEGGGKLLVK